MSKRVWRKRSALGRMACERGVASARPPSSPPTMRMAGAGRWRRLRVRCRGRPYRRFEVGAGGPGELRPELVAQHLAADLAHLALAEVAELERPIGDADQPVGGEAEMAENLFDLA